MTKEQELKLLEQIESLILTAPADSYIAMTFAGIGELCRRNITDDFGDQPVRDWEEMRNMLGAERVAHEQTKQILADAQKTLNEAMNECENLKSQVRNLGQDAANLAEEKETIAECLDGMQGICDQQDAEIRKLKAEIVRMRMERMTEEQVAELYDRMNEEE